jgi:patatin-like phospholipase/acyl hydrolase
VFVTSSLSKTEPKLQIFCNFPLSAQLKERYNNLSEEQLNSLTLVEVVRATTAAPVYFPPLTVGKMNFKDGGLVQNNPSLVALEIVRENWKDRGIELLISVGTGMEMHFHKNKTVTCEFKGVQRISSKVLKRVLNVLLLR